MKKIDLYLLLITVLQDQFFRMKPNLKSLQNLYQIVSMNLKSFR